MPASPKTPEYISWDNMLQRCYNANRADYARYGARGIRVWVLWRLSFREFLKDLGPRPEGTTLDRIDPRGDYAPGNVRWATWKTQERNRTNNRHLTHDGQTHTAAEWAEIVGLPYYIIRLRLHKGWSTERTLTTPVGPQGRKRAA